MAPRTQTLKSQESATDGFSIPSRSSRASLFQHHRRGYGRDLTIGYLSHRATGKTTGNRSKKCGTTGYHLLRVHESEAMLLADAIRLVRQNVHYCLDCYNLAEEERCTLCRDPKRDRTQLCIVEQPRDLIALEQAGVYRGLYHVLLGRIAPLDGIGPDQLTMIAWSKGAQRQFQRDHHGHQS